MRTTLSAPTSARTVEAAQSLDAFRVHKARDMMQSNPERAKQVPCSRWATLGLPEDLFFDVKMRRYSARNTWKSIIYNADTNNGKDLDGRLIETGAVATIGVLVLLPILFIAIHSGIAGLLALFLGLPVVLFLTWAVARSISRLGQSADSMDIELVDEYHKKLTDEFDSLIAEFADSYSEDLRKFGFHITDTTTGVNGPKWTTRYTATNGVISVAGSLVQDGHITETVAHAEATPEWAYAETDDFDYGTVVDMDGNVITPTGVTTKGLWL